MSEFEGVGQGEDVKQNALAHELREQHMDRGGLDDDVDGGCTIKRAYGQVDGGHSIKPPLNSQRNAIFAIVDAD